MATVIVGCAARSGREHADCDHDGEQQSYTTRSSDHWSSASDLSWSPLLTAFLVSASEASQVGASNTPPRTTSPAGLTTSHYSSGRRCGQERTRCENGGIRLGDFFAWPARRPRGA